MKLVLAKFLLSCRTRLSLHEQRLYRKRRFSGASHGSSHEMPVYITKFASENAPQRPHNLALFPPRRAAMTHCTMLSTAAPTSPKAMHLAKVTSPGGTPHAASDEVAATGVMTCGALSNLAVAPGGGLVFRYQSSSATGGK